MRQTNQFSEVIQLNQMLNDFSIDAIIAIDNNKKIIAWNKAAEIRYGKLKEAVNGRPLAEAIPSFGQDDESVKAILLAAKGIKAFLPASESYAHRSHAENHFIPLQDQLGIRGIMILVHDVAHRIKVEDQLRHLNEELQRRIKQLQATSRELASFTSITTNSIKEPIRKAYTTIEFLIKTEGIHLSDSGKASFRRIQSSLSRMDLLLNDILSLSEINVLEKADTYIEIGEAIADVIKALEPTIKEAGALVTTGELCKLKAHKVQFHSLLYAVIENGIKFNKSQQPHVHITCKKVTLEQNRYSGIPAGDYFQLTIQDNGIGFEQKEAEKIFLAFEKLHDKQFKGSGIGLAIVRKIMDAHEGYIITESDVNGGSVFHFFFTD